MSKQVEIMPAQSINELDYEQTTKKPPRIKQIEEYIFKRKLAAEELLMRIHRIEEQRPGLAFKNDTIGLRSLDAQLSKLKEEYRTIQAQIEGAENEQKQEVERWITIAIQKRKTEKAELEAEYKEIKKQVQEHLNAISEIEGTKALLLPGAYRSDRIKEQLSFGRYKDFESDIKKDILKLMNMNG